MGNGIGVVLIVVIQPNISTAGVIAGDGQRLYLIRGLRAEEDVADLGARR